MPPKAGAEAESPAMRLLHLQSALGQFQSSGRAFQVINTAATASAARRCKTLVILDSSFNPPTRAHMEMATSTLQDLRTQRNIAARLRGGSGTGSGAGSFEGDDVRLLLLLAVNNADKAPKPASFEHRLLMMQCFAEDIQRAWKAAQAETQEQHEEEDDDDELGVDIGLTTHPYFHDKSAAIATSHEYDLSPARDSVAAGDATTEQIFVAGFDTLIRIFNPKYYKPPTPEEGIIPGPQDKVQHKTPMQISLDPFLARARLRITMRTDDEWGGKEEQLAYVDSILHGDELEQVGGRKEWAKRVEMVEGMRRDEGGAVVSSTLAREAVKAKDWERLRTLVPEGVAGLIAKGEVVW